MESQAVFQAKIQAKFFLLNKVPAAEDVDDAAHQGEDHLPRLRHARGGLDKVGVPCQSHAAVAFSHLKCIQYSAYLLLRHCYNSGAKLKSN